MSAPLTTFELAAGTMVTLRRATADDVPALVRLLTVDPLGVGREHPDDLTPYRRAFLAVDADPAQLLVVAVVDDTVVGTVQLSVIPGLARGGALRGQLEAVRVDATRRDLGLGAAMIGWVVDEARRRGCVLVQLTTDRSRADAHRFYERLGFRRSHEGFKLDL